MPVRRDCCLVLAVCILLSKVAMSAPPEPVAKPIPILLDTDLGTDIDDAFALGLILASPELELRGITTVGEQAEDRAWLACRFLTQCGRSGIPVAAGQAPQPDTQVNDQMQYRRHPAALFNRTQKPVTQSAVELLYGQLKAAPGELTIVAIGPLTNIGRLFKEHPDAPRLVKRIVLMGGSVHLGYNGKAPPEPEWNIKLDAAAARTVFTAGVPLVIAPLDATATVKLTKPYRDTLFSAHTPLTFQIQNLYELWDQETPTLYDPVAVAGVFDESFCKYAEVALTVEDNGLTRVTAGKPNARAAVSIDQDKFLNWFVARLSKVGEPTLPKPPRNVSQRIEQGAFPRRVPVAEDYDLEIERRWWMSGKPETKDLPPGSRRACRAVLTQDFDDRQGDVKTMYRAVIFNPVTGPPMGPKTRLSFRYKLHGTSTIRVQLYSLSKEYHRYLSVTDLPQDQWHSATVDMTSMRRPDGSGGPLSEGERIDDIQFYIDPRAELLIDDVMLYEAAADNERRPFPQRVIFTGWFDTGKQGVEWPGSFEIEPHSAPRTGRCARSVKQEKSGEPWIRLALRGERRLSAVTELKFETFLKNANSFKVELCRGGQVLAEGARDVKSPREAWTETTLKFEVSDADRWVDEIRFIVPAGGELRVDDVLLYEPGK